MSSQIGNVVFIIWRESVEALLVIGILNAWLQNQDSVELRAQGRRWLWSGTALGVILALVFGLILALFSEHMDDDVQELAQTIAMLVAGVLIVQMVLWMKRNGRTLKKDLEGALQSAAARSHWWGVFFLALIAVAREGSETVIFLYGTLAAGAQTSLAPVLLAIALGFALAGGTYALLQIGSRILNWRSFFRLTEIMLLCLAASLFVSGVDHLVSMGALDVSTTKLWDTSDILPDSGPIGGLISALTGYRARPDAVELVVFFGYWAMIWALFARWAPAPMRQKA